LVASLATACAQSPKDGEARWVHGKISMIAAANQLPGVVEKDCVPSGALASVETAVVKYRMVRAYRYVAVPAADGTSWQVGQAVSLNLTGCELRSVKEQ
jgi:hypothetical protein